MYREHLVTNLKYGAIYYSPKLRLINLVYFNEKGCWRVFSDNRDFNLREELTIINLVNSGYELIGYV